MSRKNVYNYVIIDNQDGSTSFDTFLKPTNVNYLDNSGIQVLWSGTLLGQLKIYASNDQVQGTNLPTNWSELDFGSSIVIDNTNSDIIINMNQLPFSWIALEYISTSGTGSITAKLTTKMVGG